ncbi:MAG: carbamoyltransferase N-terminal domain-containing protein [Pseudomonadota bacterium]
MTAPGFVLGISSHFHDSAAALVQGDRIIAAAQEERFTRRKGDWHFPDHAAKYCLAQLPPGAELAGLAYYEDPAIKARRIVETAICEAPSGARLWPRMVKILRTLSDDLPDQLTALAGDPAKVVFVPHHRAHAASAFYPSPFDKAAILIMDGVGEVSTTTIWSGTASGLSAQSEVRFPHSLGLFYSAFTQYCGFKVNSGEYKLMGLAPFGVPTFRKKIRDELIELRADGSFALNMRYFDFHRGLSTIAPEFQTLFGLPVRQPDDPVTPFHMNLAASAQSVLEEAVVALAKASLNQTGHRHLCLAGGVALNCVANARIRQDVPDLDGLWIQPAAGDAGGALGAALEMARAETTARPRAVAKPDGMARALLGPAFDDGVIRAELDAAGLIYETIGDPASYAHAVADTLAGGQIVGHFDGRMEFGPRALGNRSILADPRGAATLRKTNRKIKFREDWRPFAPMVLAEEAPRYFEDAVDSPYMLFVASLKPDYRLPATLRQARARGVFAPMQLQNAVQSQFDAITHVDFTARLQTIRPDSGQRAGAILSAFYDQTGCPMLLNTSFNVRGEPIVCGPKDAIDCFLNTHLDLLAIGGFLVRRTAQPDWVNQRIGRKTFAAD